MIDSSSTIFSVATMRRPPPRDLDAGERHELLGTIKRAAPGEEGHCLMAGVDAQLLETEHGGQRRCI